MQQNTTPILGHTSHGEGKEHVILLHDWLGDSTTWQAVVPYLDARHFTYAFVDLRGYGKSKTLTGRFTVDEIAGDVLRLADALGWQRFHVVGHSMTGMATERLVADAPARIKSAIAVCPISAAGNKLDDATRAFFRSTLDDDDAFRRLIRFVCPGLSDGWAEAKLRQNRSAMSKEAGAAYLKMLTTADFVDEVRGAATPFLVLVAENDPGLDEAAMQTTFLAWHPNAELAIIKASGHYPMQERPPAFVAMVEAFLRKHVD